MLETLVSSRIRRTLLEHILRHPQERFYLRGLAKELALSVTPLRRELKRLERSGMLGACQEGNMLFYTVNTATPQFLQLKQAGLGTQEAAQGSMSLQPMQIGVISASPAASWRSPLFLGAAGVGMAFLLIMGALVLFSAADRRMASRPSRILTAQRAGITVVMPPQPSASGAMRGSRWQVVPGGFGGFSSAPHEGETY